MLWCFKVYYNCVPLSVLLTYFSLPPHTSLLSHQSPLSIASPDPGITWAGWPLPGWWQLFSHSPPGQGSRSWSPTWGRRSDCECAGRWCCWRRSALPCSWTATSRGSECWAPGPPGCRYHSALEEKQFISSFIFIDSLYGWEVLIRKCYRRCTATSQHQHRDVNIDCPGLRDETFQLLMFVFQRTSSS